MKKKKYIDGISIREFVNYYLETNHDCRNLRHQGLKSFNNPYVVGVSNDYALKYPDSIMKNELIVVIDDYGNPGTYLNPKNIKKLIELETNKEKLRLLSNISCHSFDEAAFLYKLWKIIADEVKCLESLYSYNYVLFDLMNKSKVVRQIKNYAKEEAKRTLIFTVMQHNDNIEETSYCLDDYQLSSDNISSYDSSEDMYDQYRTTEKNNRQKVLMGKRKGIKE